jgi:SOS response regulatory protein OraA/RecX
MKTGKKIALPPRGYQQELARLAGCSDKTVVAALRRNSKGIKAERVRQLFRAKYGNSNE